MPADYRTSPGPGRDFCYCRASPTLGLYVRSIAVVKKPATNRTRHFGVHEFPERAEITFNGWGDATLSCRRDETFRRWRLCKTVPI